jgi:hypothetical protein
MPALNLGRFKGEPRPIVATMYISSISLAVGLTGSFSGDVVHSSVPAAAAAAGGLGFVRIESGWRLPRAADKELPPLDPMSMWLAS